MHGNGRMLNLYGFHVCGQKVDFAAIAVAPNRNGSPPRFVAFNKRLVPFVSHTFDGSLLGFVNQFKVFIFLPQH